MKLRNYLVCAVALAAAVCTTALPAQEQKKGGRGGGLSIERVEEAVGPLTDEQKKKIEAINAKMREQMQALPQEERQAKRREVMQANRTEVRAVLTPEQQKKFDAMPQGGPGKKKDQ